MPNIGDQITFETPYYIIGHESFPRAEAVMAGGTIGNYDITYALDTGAGYGSFKNLYYGRAGGGGSNGSTNVTMTSTTGVAAGDHIFGTNIAPGAKVVSITDGTTIVVDTANIGSVSGTLRFTQLPSESSIPSTGFKMKIRIKTVTANATAMTSLLFYTFSTPTTRAYQYPLDTADATLTLTGLQTGTEVHVYRASDDEQLAVTESTAGSTFTYDYEWIGTDEEVYITVIKPGYKWIRYNGIDLISDGVTIPVFQTLDRGYSNP